MPELSPAGSPLRAARWATLALAATLAACAAPGPQAQAPVRHARAEPMYFYPRHQQPIAQQERDRYECYRWAVQQTGRDPGMTPVQTTRRVADPYAGRDTAVGALAGATFGSLAASPGHGAEGAMAGLVIGALIGAASDQQRAHALQDSAARPVPAADPRRFQRAMSACMAGRGYVVG
jgi:hypothetical protein